ncbi:MAG TPA: hypothetical protein VFJ96_05745 [Gemmatimonadaceae bacterium]|nr:hypothetical protein [Gemmatimonadaceae bacterium]
MHALAVRWHSVRAHPLRSRIALIEAWHEWRGGHPVASDHEPHLLAAVDWLVRSQDATPDDGFSRGYSLTWNLYLHQRRWQPSYPETTGYLIPTLYELARVTDRPDLAQRAERAARWEATLQLPSGAVRGGVVGQHVSPAVFNTGQVIFGWLSAYEETGDEEFAKAAARAAKYLVSVQDDDGHWRIDNSHFARADATLYNARTAWALAEAGVRLRAPAFRDAAAHNLRAVAAKQYANGWFPACCLSDPRCPLLHTLAYTIRGLLEGGRVLEDSALIWRAELAAGQLAECVRDDGWMAGRFDERWTPAVAWSCLTGEAQMANVWLRLSTMTGRSEWLGVARRVLRFLEHTQNRTSACAGIRGAIRGAWPMHGAYGAYEVLSWATKFFVDALLRDMAIGAGGSRAKSRAFALA